MQEPLNQNEPTARSIADHLYTLMQQYDPQFMQQYPNREVQVSETEHAICSGDLNDFFQIEMMALAVRKRSTTLFPFISSNKYQIIGTTSFSHTTG